MFSGITHQGLGVRFLYKMGPTPGSIVLKNYQYQNGGSKIIHPFFWQYILIVAWITLKTVNTIRVFFYTKCGSFPGSVII